MYSAETTETLLRRFLDGETGFDFHLKQYLESTRYLDPQRPWLGSFAQQFTVSGTRPLNAWPAAALADAVQGVAAYSGFASTQPKPWTSIPIISKADLLASPDAYVSDRYDRSDLWLRSTSGTTGPPVEIWYAPEYAHRQIHAEARIAWVAGELSDELRRAPTFSVALTDRKGVRDVVWADPTGFQGLTLRPAFDEGNPGEVSRIAAILHRHPGALLVLRPNVLRSILERSAPRDLTALRRVRLVICSGSRLDEELRERAERLLRVRVCCAYGLTEVGIVASECRQGSLHVYENDVFCEVLGTDGRVSSEGRGELVASSVLNNAMPLLRYRTGDIVEMTAQPCPCGKHGRRIVVMVGRTIRNFPLPDGSEVSPTVWDRLFRQYSIRECRVIQRHLDEIDVEIEFTRDAGDWAEDLERIRREIQHDTRGQVKVRARATTLASASAFERYVCLVAERSFRG